MIAELEQSYPDIDFDMFLDAVENRLGEKVSL
jgi:hypothetical protein